MNNNRIIKKPRVKSNKDEHRFWCFYHKRFFDEEKKTIHCIPKGCFEFDRNYYTYRICIQKDEDRECHEIVDIGEAKIRELGKSKGDDNQGLTLRLTESQRRFLKRALGREVKGVIIRGDIHSPTGFDGDNHGMDSLSIHAVGLPEY